MSFNNALEPNLQRYVKYHRYPRIPGIPEIEFNSTGDITGDIRFQQT